MDVVLAFDNDADAATTYRANFPNAAFVEEDIRKVKTAALAAHLASHPNSLWLFSACAPCQPFSKHRRSACNEDDRSDLLMQFLRFVKRYLPAFILVENVPGLRSREDRGSPFGSFVRALAKLSYHLETRDVESWDYGVPQCRRRLFVMGSRCGEVEFPRPTHGPGTASGKYSTVWEWIGDLPPIPAGGTDETIPNHTAALLSPTNLERIKATPEAGGRRDWPEHLWLRCHEGPAIGYSDVYGRMRKDAPANALTTRCISLSNGRFGHPVQDRAISVREAACLQTFPRDFIFCGPRTSMARQIGNAVPVLLAQQFGESFVRHAATHGRH